MKICNKCNASMEDFMLFCSNCGNPFENTASTDSNNVGDENPCNPNFNTTKTNNGYNQQSTGESVPQGNREHPYNQNAYTNEKKPSNGETTGIVSLVLGIFSLVSTVILAICSTMVCLIRSFNITHFFFAEVTSGIEALILISAFVFTIIAIVCLILGIIGLIINSVSKKKGNTGNVRKAGKITNIVTILLSILIILCMLYLMFTSISIMSTLFSGYLV